MTSKKPKSSRRSAGSKEKGHPDDIFPMVLTSATQELFGCRTDEDVTGENPYKILKKEDIIQDIKTRAAVSDFSPVKQIVLDYPEDEMLLVFDRDFTYNQSFYLVLKPESKDRILNPPQPETESPEVTENEVNKTPKQKQWISLGSEKEIDEESVKETRPKLRFKFSSVRRKFGTPCHFSDNSTVCIQCPSYQDSRFNIKLMQRDCGIQAIPALQSSSAQTQWKQKRNAVTQYEPRELSEEEKKNIVQSESLKEFLNSVTPRVLYALQQAEIMNVFVDDLKALGTAAEDDDDWYGDFSKDLMLYQAFTDQQYTKNRKINSVNWHPSIYGVIAVALANKKDQQLVQSTFNDRPSFIVFYSFSHPSKAQLLLEFPDDICAFDFCPSDPNIIVGGSMSGQVVLWDISAHVAHLQGTQDLDDKKKKETPVVHHCAVSAVESSHKAPITNVQWLPPTFEVTRIGLPVENKYKMSVQVVTCSPDCSIMFWDVRTSKLQSQSLSGRKQKTQLTPYSVPDTFKHLNRMWKPLFKVSLLKIDTSGEYAPLKFNLEHYTCNSNNRGSTTEDAEENDDSSEVVPDYSQLRMPSATTLKPLDDVNTKLYVGTEDGEIVYTDWKLVKDDQGVLHSAKPLYCFNSHYWLVHTIQRSPFFKDILLTTGGWNFAIWKEGVVDGPIIQSPNSEPACTAGCWSLSRPAVFFIGKEDGSIEVWNLLKNTSAPVQVHNLVTNAKVTCIKPWIASPKQHFLAVTDDLGMVRVLKIPKTLCVSFASESSELRTYFELEEERLKDLLKRKEEWEKEKKEAEELKKKMEPERPAESMAENEEADLKAYRDYLELEERILKSFGLWRGSGDA